MRGSVRRSEQEPRLFPSLCDGGQRSAVVGFDGNRVGALHFGKGTVEIRCDAGCFGDSSAVTQSDRCVEGTHLQRTSAGAGSGRGRAV